jgi:FixJ family two-component response regulator
VLKSRRSVEAMKKRAVDFSPKPSDLEDLRDAIIHAIVRNTWIETLTPRKREVMRWVIAGMLNKQIAHELGTSEKTRKVH